MKTIVSKKTWSLKRDILTLYYAFKHPGTPWYAKVTALLSLLYLISPADLVPDLIPFAGIADDIVIVPFLLNISTKLLPHTVLVATEERARRNSRRLGWLMAVAAVIVIALVVWLIVKWA